MPIEGFPNLYPANYARTSPETPAYNCVAWALGINKQWYEPDPMGQWYWPPGVPRELTLDAYKALFELHGFRECSSREFEGGIEKVALFALPDATPTHVARQQSPPWWTSKLGKDIDMRHYLEDLEGPSYGRVAVIMARPLR